jgi:hypothetical protein
VLILVCIAFRGVFSKLTSHSNLSLEQVHDGVLAGVPEGASKRVNVARHGHLDETEGEHGGDDTLGKLKSPGAVVERVVSRVPAGVVVLVTGEEDLRIG